MSDYLTNNINSNLLLKKLEDTMSLLSEKLNQPESSAIVRATNEIYQILITYFKNIDKAEFEPEYITTNDTPRSEHYNKNLNAIYNDISRFYDDLKNLTNLQIKSFNFSQVVAQDILSRANSLSSIVLDLNILNNFTRGDVIVAGDDFDTMEYIDVDAGLGSELAELIPGGGGLTLARDSAVNLITNNTKLEIIPISPASQGQDSVNTQPTPGNLERFYEGNYYNFLGLARPEGGKFNIKFLLEPPSTANSELEKVGTPENPVPETPLINQGLIVEIGASDEEKELARQKVLDGDPTSFWECEYCYRVATPLISDIGEQAVEDEKNEGTTNQSATVVIDLEKAEKVAKEFDFPGRDLVVDIILTLEETRPMNFLSINPILFGSSAFPEIVDVSTSSEIDGEFVRIDNWDSLKFAKTITPEANEFLTDSQVGAVLSPSRASYKGQGVFPFPMREARKIKIRLKMDNPVPAPYERIYALMTNNIKTTTVTTTTTTRRRPF